MMTEAYQIPTIFLGGFNVTKDDDVIKRIKEFFTDTYTKDELDGCAYPDYNGGRHCLRIDYIFYDKTSGLQLNSFEIDRRKTKQYPYL